MKVPKQIKQNVFFFIILHLYTASIYSYSDVNLIYKKGGGLN